jgi:hypothetical protein
MAAVTLSFHQRKQPAPVREVAAPAAPAGAAAAAAGIVAMEVDSDEEAAADGAAAAAASASSAAAAVAAGSSSALARWGKRVASTLCLVLDSSRLPADGDLRNNVLALIAAEHQPPAQAVAAVLALLPGLAAHGLAWVFKAATQFRLHLHFHEHAHLAHALKAVPALVRCGVLPGSKAWNGCLCGPERHKHPEALLLSCRPVVPLPTDAAQRNAAIKDLLVAMNIDVQDFWFSASQLIGLLPDGASGLPSRCAFYALPREADPTALVGLVERVHRQHLLWGGLVSVQGRNLPQTSRCSECSGLGHEPSAFPIFTRIAKRPWPASARTRRRSTSASGCVWRRVRCCNLLAV